MTMTNIVIGNGLRRSSSSFVEYISYKYLQTTLTVTILPKHFTNRLFVFLW